jgi:SAM-dependent methyltransferase
VLTGSRQRVALWAELPPRTGQTARRGRALLDSLSTLFEVEVFVADEDVPAPELMSRYRVYPRLAFDRRHAQAPFDAVIAQPDADSVTAAARPLGQQHPGLRIFGVSPEADGIPPGVPDPLGVRPELEREMTRASLGIRPGTFVVGLACDFQYELRDGGEPSSMSAALEALAALTRAIDVLILVGLDGHRRTRRALESMLRAHALQRHVLTLTPRSIDQADDHLLACDAAVVLAGAGAPPYAAIRALAAGLPVVAIGKCAADIPESACVPLPPDAAPPAIEAALVTIATDSTRRAQLARDARACYERHFTMSAMAEAYRSAIDGRSGAAVSERPPHQARPDTAAARPGALRFNKACEIEDFSHPDLAPLVHDDLGGPPRLDRAAVPPWDRKQWEVAMAVRTLETFGAVHPQAGILGVAAGMEDTIYRLAPLVREITVVDRYLQPGEWDSFAAPWMTVAPELGMRVRPGRQPEPAAALVRAAHMDARRLRFADNTFDGIFSSGSIEHVGGLDDIAHAAYEMGRVLKPGGVLSISTELLLWGPADPHVMITGNMILLRRDQILRYIVEASGLELVDDLATDISAPTRATRQAIGHAFAVHGARTAEAGVRAAGWSDRLWTRPYIVLEHVGYLFGSVHIALRKTSSYPHTPNAWAQPGPRLFESLVRDRQDLVPALGGWGPVAAVTASGRGTRRLAAVAARVGMRAHERHVACRAARDAMATLTSEMHRVERELKTLDASEVERELARLRDEVRRLSARTAEIERHAVGWRMLMRGLVTVLTPSPAPVNAAAPEGMRAHLLRAGRMFKPVARRLPRVAAYVRRWIHAG